MLKISFNKQIRVRKQSNLKDRQKYSNLKKYSLGQLRCGSLQGEVYISLKNGNGLYLSLHSDAYGMNVRKKSE